MKSNPSMKAKVRRARCKQVLAILCNRLETVDLIREEIHPPTGDFAEHPLEVAVVRWYGLEVVVPLDCVVFLGHQPYAERAKTWGLQFLAMAGRHSKPEKPKRVSRKRMRKLPPEVEATLRFISENMKLSGFSGQITPELEAHTLKLYQQGKLRGKPPLFGPRQGDTKDER